MFDQTPDRWSVSSGIQTARGGLKGGADESFSFTGIKCLPVRMKHSFVILFKRSL